MKRFASLLGWIGLTALGTLPVLLPTSVNNFQNGVSVQADADELGVKRSGRSQKNRPNAA
mgnify:CR=1 FL=1